MDIENLLQQSLAKPTESIREHTDKVKNQAAKLKELNYIPEETYRLLELACEYHDYGKLNREFQNRMNTKAKFNSEKEIAHNVLSTYFLNKSSFEQDNDYLKVFYAVLNHHFHTNNFSVLESEQKMSLDLLSDFDIQNLDLNDLRSFKSDLNESYYVLTGLLNKCDYSASGNYLIEYENDFLLNFLQTLNYPWNDLQNYLIENRDENIIAVASTGMGKTEAGLFWIGNNKGFFVLPLKTAINSIYDRITQKLIKSKVKEQVFLLHSEATDYLITNTDNSYEYIKEYEKIGRTLSLPLTISTLDQIFNFVFMYSGHELTLATLSYSKVVIDEIQAYSPDLLAYIVIGLKKIKDVGGKFAILTATLPPFIKKCIEDEIGPIKYKSFMGKINRHNLEIENSQMTAESIYKHYLKKRKKTLVVCNTIKKAQELYRELLELGIKKIEIELLHSKYLKKDRLEKERDILNFGKIEVEGDKIWISTSLVEVSLDIDFDYLFTELNDLSGLFQRLGRVNRKGKKSIEETNAFVFTEINPNLFINGKKGFIDKDIFNLSKKALEEVNNILSEEQKYNLIEKYFTMENLKESNFMKKFRRNKNYIKEIWPGKYTKDQVANEFRDIVSYKCIPKKVYEDNKDLIDELIERYTTEQGESKENARKELNMYTLNLGIYDKGKFATLRYIESEQIYFVNGDYSYELGFERDKQEKENDFDSFL